MVSVSVHYYLFCQPINVKIKTWSLRFPAKENPNMEKIGQLCCSMTSKRSIDWFLESTSGVKCFHSSVRLTNQKPRAFVSVRWTNQIALSIARTRTCQTGDEEEQGLFIIPVLWLILWKVRYSVTSYLHRVQHQGCIAWSLIGTMTNQWNTFV